MQGGDDRLVPFRGGKHDLHRARGDDVQRVPGIALVEDHLVAPESTNAQMVGHRLEHATLAAEEERTLAEAVDREPIVGHRSGDPSHALTARAAPDIWAAVQRSVAAWGTSDEASVHCCPVPLQLPVVTSPAHLAHDGLLEVMGGRPVPCYEKPERISAIERALMDAGGHRFMPVREHGLRPITDVHEPALVDLLEHVWTDAIASGATDGAAPLIPV